MSKVKVFLNPWGGIEKYRFPRYMNPITTMNPFGLEHWMDDELEDCEVFDADGAHVRDAVLDDRGNVGDFEGPLRLPSGTLYVCNPGEEGRSIPTNQLNGLRVSVGNGNIFGARFEMRGASEKPKGFRNLCSIGSFCTFGSDVVLDTGAGFRIQNACRIGDGTVILGHLDMGDWSSIGANGTVHKLGSLSLEPSSSVGDNAKVVGDVHLGFDARVGKGAWFKKGSYANIPAQTNVASGLVHSSSTGDLDHQP